MSTGTKTIVSLYTESTPNPLTMKFVINRMLLQGYSVDYKNAAEATAAPLATALLEMPYVNGIFIKNNFVSVTKTQESLWDEIIPELREFLRSWLGEDKEVFTADALEAIKAQAQQDVSDKSEIEKKIIDLIQEFVQPAVEMDGGSIVFKAYDEGVVTLGMEGACSGCPSSTITLKNGIQGLLQRMMPEGTISAVIAEDM